MWNVTLYSETGLNSVNTIDKPERLQDSEETTVPALDLLQGELLQEIKIKATRDQVKNVDYLKLEDTSSGDEFFYSVEGWVSTSLDVQVLRIVPDAIMTAAAIVGEIGNVEFGDGVTERHHVAKSEDTYGAFPEDDPLLVPSQELEFNIWKQWDGDSNGKHLVESTMSLANMAARRDAITYTGDGGTVTVPQTVPAMDFTSVDIGVTHSHSTYVTPGSEYYDHSKEGAQVGIARIRSLGAEGCILNSWIVPEEYCDYLPDENTGYIRAIGGKEIEETSGIHFLSGPGVKNMRLKYGSLNTIEFINPAEGTRMSFLPEDICETRANPGQLKVGLITDPRPSGRPYFFPAYYKGNSLGARYFSQMLPGARWSNAPLVYTGNSGADITEIKYNANRQYANAQAKMQQDQIFWGSVQSHVGNIFGGAQAGLQNAGSLYAPMEQAYTMDTDGGIYNWEAMTQWKNAQTQKTRNWNSGVGAMSTGLSMLGNAINTEIGARVATEMVDRQYRANATKELQNLALATYVQIPQMVFPRSECLRDFIGNGLVLCQYHPSDRDLEKLDTLMEMYGYRDTAVLDKSMFTKRSKFNYIQAKSISVIDKRLPLWLRELVASQLKNGCRIWRQLPDATAYTDGSNI